MSNIQKEDFHLNQSASDFDEGLPVGRSWFSVVETSQDVASLGGKTVKFPIQFEATECTALQNARLLVDASFTAGDGTQLPAAMGIGPSMDWFSTLLSKINFQIGSKVVSEIEDNVPQVSAIIKRLFPSKGYLDTLLEASDFMQADPIERVNKIVSDANEIKQFEYVAQPVDLGYADNTKTCAYTSADSLLTFNVGVPALNTGANPFAVGDIIRTPTTDYVVRAAAGAAAATILVSGPSIDRAAETFVRVRRKKAALRRDRFQTMWQVPLGIFHQPKVLPSGSYSLNLTFQSAANMQILPWEAIYAGKAAGATAATVKVTINSIKLLLHMFNPGNRFDGGTFDVDLINTRMIAASLDNVTSQQTKSFEIAADTPAFMTAVAVQGQDYLSNQLVTPTKFTTSANDELNISKLYVTYGNGNTKPESVLQDQIGIAGGGRSNLMTLSYASSLMALNNEDQKISGAEKLSEWIQRGPLHIMDWPADSSFKGKNITVYVTFSTAPGAGRSSLLLFTFMKQQAKVTVDSGVVTSVVVKEG